MSVLITGSEITDRQVQDTIANFLAQRFRRPVFPSTASPSELSHLIISGGIGAAPDDPTREAPSKLRKMFE